MNFAKIAETFVGGIVVVAVLAVAFTAKNTGNVINQTGGFVKSSLGAAEAPVTKG